MAINPFVNKVVYGDQTIIDISDTTAVAADVASGKYFYTAAGQKVQGTASGGGGAAVSIVDTQDAGGGTIRTITAVNLDDITKTSSDLTASGATVTAPAGYYASDATKSVASGSVTAPSTISGSGASVSTGTNTITLTKTVSVTPNVTAAGYISSGTAGDASVSLTASVNTRTSSDLTASGATVTAPAGYYASAATKSVSSGTEGTPTATKGTVSNHSVTVTPSVTNSAGYISGGTKTGTAVTVSASELVSGSETKTANGTYDVTNLAELVVNVSASGGKNGQLQSKVARTSQTTYTDMGFEITVSKAGKYNVYWSGYRSSTSGTSGAQVYVNDNAQGTANTTFDGTYTNCQTGVLSNVTLAVNDKVKIRARARNTSSYMYIYNLAIIEV